MGTIRFIVALMLLLSALSSCDKFSSADGGMKENAIIATSDAIEIDHHHSRNHNKDVSRTEKSYSSQNEEMYAFEKRKYIEINEVSWIELYFFSYKHQLNKINS